MTTCRACGNEIAGGDDVIVVAEATLHAGCVEAPKGPKRRRVGAWGAMGAAGQMAMGDVQRDTPTD